MARLRKKDKPDLNKPVDVMCPICGSRDTIDLRTHYFCNHCPTRQCFQPVECPSDPVCEFQNDGRLNSQLCRGTTEFTKEIDRTLVFPFNVIFSSRKPENIGYEDGSPVMAFTDFFRKPLITLKDIGLVENR